MWYKGIKIILDGLRALANSGRDFRMIFVGDGTERKEIEKYSDALRLKKNCIFAGAVTSRETLRAYYSLADMFLFPSSFDTNGIVVREAAACGLPSVLLKDSCASEGIEDGHTGILIDENAESMYSALIAALDGKYNVKTIGQNAMDEIYISWDSAVKKATERYEIVLENAKSGQLIRREAPSDEFFQFICEVNTATERVRDATAKIRRRIEKM